MQVEKRENLSIASVTAAIKMCGAKMSAEKLIDWQVRLNGKMQSPNIERRHDATAAD